MIMYSIIPVEEIFAGIDKEQAPIVELEINGITMQVQSVNDQQARIVRLISPNPQDFLNPSYAPGQLIQFQPHTTK